MVFVATLPQKLQIKFAVSTSHRKLTPGQPVSPLTPSGRASDKVAIL